MSNRAYNFSAGPGALPEPVIKQAQKDLWDFDGSGMGVCELSHRGPEFDKILGEAFEDCRAIGKISDEYEVMFLQGGATMQADMVPMNFLKEGQTAQHIDTGKWANDTIKEAGFYAKLNGAKVHVAGSTKNETYCRLPMDSECSYIDDAAYTLYVSNNTIYGTQFNRIPAVKGPIVCDMSSDMFSRPIDYSKFSMIYAGAQKNLGPSGQVLVIMKKSFMETAYKGRNGRMHEYAIHAEKESRFNTPNTWAIYMMGQNFKWLLKEFGSLEQVSQYNSEKAKILYDAIDASDFFTGHVTVAGDRSLMNIPFRTPSEELDTLFLAEAEKQGLKTLAGHRDTGGMRASIYNAFPIEGVKKLVEFMQGFEMAHKGKTSVASA